MSISNTQFDVIMREYESRRTNSHRIYLEHKDEVIEMIPEYKKLEDEITDIAIESAGKYFGGDTGAITEMKERMQALQNKQKELLDEYGFPEDYLVEKHECEDCQDTGYIDNKKCHCLTQKIIRVLYKQSNVEESLERENFSTLSYDYYDDADLDMMKRIIGECKNFASDFDNKYENLLLFGNVGVGKTFLTNCIAKELLECGKSVIYFTSIRLFDTLAKCVFNRDEDSNEDISGILKDLYSCDLLIIDDLGTETASMFVASRLFDILNERDVRSKSTVISTNLKVDEITKRYSERNFSRIFGNYKVLNPDIGDIRIKKRRKTSI